MTCAIPNGVELRFIESGIRIAPYKVDIRAERRNYMHGQLIASRAVGELIKNEMLEAEPVILEFDDETSHRFYIPTDGIEFFFNVQGDPRTRIDLLDPRKVLSRGNIDANYGSITLSEVVDDILNDYRDDPNGVITDVQYTGEDMKEKFLADAGGQLFQASDENAVALGQLNVGEVTGFSEWLTEQFERLSDPDNVYSGFEFDNVSPLEAMQRVMDEFNHQWWIEADGTLMIGQDGTFGNIVAKSADNSDIVFERYDVVESSTKTNRVLLSAPLPRSQNTEELRGVDIDVSTRLRNVAIASAPDLEGQRMDFANKKSTTQGVLRQDATRLLYEEIMSDVNGSIVINGMASDDTAAVAQLQPGDHFLVEEAIKYQCKESAVTGHFLVNSIKHNASTSRGWRATVRLTRVVPHSEIETRSFYYDPTTGERYNDLDALESDNYDDLPNVGSP